MTRALVVVVALAAPAVAHAGHHCRETSDIVGYQSCSGFGGWSFGATLAVELGASFLRYGPDAISATGYSGGAEYHIAAASGDDRPITARGMRIRPMIGLGRRFYVASQLDLATITGGPQLVADITERGMTTTGFSATRGWIAQEEFLLGAHARFGDFTVAGELAPGARFVSYTSSAIPDSSALTMQSMFVLEVHPKVDYWLTPNIAVGLEGGVDVLRGDGFAGAVVLGFHVLPFDSAR